jgi:STE24 endopeptidase
MAMGTLEEPRVAAGRQEKARAYARERLRLSLTSAGVDLLVLVVILLTGFSLAIERTVTPARGWAAAPAAIVLWYSIGFGLLLKAVSLPFSVASHRLEIRYELNCQSWGSFWWDEVKGAGIGAVLGLAAVELVYWLLRAAPLHWWLIAWAAFLLFGIVLAQLAPVLLFPLFFKFRPLSDEGSEGELRRRLTALAARAGTRVRGIFEWKLGEKSKKANAALTGWGRTRRVILSDTLLASAGADEIEAVFAHELGHHVRRHIWQGLTFQAMLALFGFWVADRALNYFSARLDLRGIADVAGLPLLILVSTVVSFLLLPVANAFSRRMERQADDYAFTTMGGVEPLVAGLERLAQLNLAEVAPPRWKELIFYSHPSIVARIERARRWKASNA